MKYLFILLSLLGCGNTPLVRSPLSQPPKPLMAIRSSSDFSYLQLGVLHISLRTHKTQHTQPREKRTNKHGLGLSPSARRKKFETLLHSFLCICGLSRACIRVKFPQSYQERWLIVSSWPTRSLDPQVLAVAFSLQLTVLFFCSLPPSVDCPVLSTGFFCSALGLFFPRLLPVSSGDLPRKPFLWVLRQNRQRNALAGTHPHPHNERPHRATGYGIWGSITLPKTNFLTTVTNTEF